MTVELNSSLVLLPKVPMQSRYFDPRVGYFAIGYTDFDANPQGVKSVAPSAKFVTVNGAGVRQTAVTVAQDAVTRENDFNIATGCNSDMAMGALQAFKSAGFGGATNKKPDHTYFYSINGTYEELVALTDPNSPLMADLGLAPKEIAETLINTEVKMIKGKIKPYGTYTFNVPDTPLTTNCAAANTFDKVEYFATKNLPCVK